MASNSDHDNTRINIVDTLPTVYQSDVNKTLFEASFNKFLTKDDTSHVAGYIGTGNPHALVDKQLLEPTPHRQAFQLAPVMYSTIGTEEYTLTFKGFQQQLQLMGVDITNMDQWGSTERFNWIPPVNLDMLVNYTDYFWKPKTGQTAPQHFTIENRCNKATSKLNAYKAIITRRGATMEVVRIDFANNAFVIGSKHDDLFVDEFMFNTKGSGNINLDNMTWIATSSTYNGDTDETTIFVSPDISIRTDIVDVTNPPPAPTAMYEGQWWYKYSTTPSTPLSQLYTWTGSVWAITGQSFPCVISLEDQEAVYQAEVNCACESDTGGWDTKQWDDNQKGSIVWNTDLLSNISFNTEAEWIANNTQTSAFDLWYDLSTDELKQRNADNTSWSVVQESFSQALVETTGTALWDASVGCTLQDYDQWSASNEWVHKSELTTFVGAKRAQVPILEYSSQTEMNEWTELTHAWKYRTEQGKVFDASQIAPSRLELEPIKSYVASNVDGVWFLFLTTEYNSANRDIDYTNIFTSGYKFRIVDRNGFAELFTSVRSVYREIGDTDPAYLPRGKFCTIVELLELDFPAPEVAGVNYEVTIHAPDAPYTRIEPIRTSAGDPWKGYHIHWLLDVANTSQRATSAQMANPYVKRSDVSSAETIPGPLGAMYVTETYQEFVPATNGISQVDLHYSFHYDPSHPGYFAVAGENSLRVYVNGVRQYGTYREVAFTSPGTPDYTVVDGVDLPANVAQSSFNYVYAIQFNRALFANDVVRIEVAPPSFYDMGTYAVPARTIADDAAFKSAAAAGTQPAYKSLARYQRNEQVKVQINQYPLFNVYDVITGEVVKTAPIFGFVESTDYPVDSSTQRRIVASSDGKEYQFEQFLVDEDNGVMYAYRSITEETPAYWYSPLTETLREWDGKTWADKIVSNVSTGMVAYTPLVSSIEPVFLRAEHKSVWVNPDTLEFWERDAINNQWIQLDGDVEVSNADPTLETIWKTSTTTPVYVPQYVDSTRTPVEKGSASGDWEVVSQWKNNPEHENHKTVLFSQLVTHLSQITSQQERVPGLTNRGIFTLRQQDYDYGVGGTIKEHNDAYDTLISAVNVTEMTPVGVMEFAQEQYTSNLVIIRDIFNASIVDLLINNSGNNVDTIKTNVSQYCISEFEQNDFVAKVYGDTTAYNAATTVGMPNWIATSPMFGLSEKVKPVLINDGTSSIITHHDGHRSFVSYTLAEQDRMIRGLVNEVNASAPGMAVISSTQPTGSTLPVFWYYVGNGHHELYKLKSSIHVEWELIDFVDILGQVYLDIEQRLYDATPAFPIPVFDFEQLTNTADALAVYENRLYDRFMDYVVKRDIKAPLINTGYSITDPYTWNYSQCITDVPPTSLVTPAPRACWQSLYEMWYGTPYPHLEPWKLQGYTDKPTWWDNEYVDHTEARRWKYNHSTKVGMWENIRVGNIPAGYLYPNSKVVSSGNAVADGISLPKYNYFSVNISDDTLAGGYLPDDMLPPYFDNTLIAPIHPTVRSLFRVFTTQIIAPSSDYAFGDVGPIEWEWSISSEHVYDRSIIAFLMHPVTFLRQTFGLDYVTIKGLQVDVITKKVYNHKEAMFHGDIYDTNKTYVANGLNQWYVNLNRHRGFDTNVGFRDMWTGWTPRQSYQTAGIVDTSTLQLFNKNFDITSKDYDIVLGNSGVLTETWVDAFDVSIINIPAVINQYNNQAQWKFSVDTMSPVSRGVEFYGVQVWPFAIDHTTDVLTAFSFKIVDVTASVSIFNISGDQTAFLLDGVSLVVTGSSTNDGGYTVVRATYDTVNNVTRVKVAETVTTSIADGMLDIVDYAHNWATGDVVVMSSTLMLPYPILDKTPYYVIKLDSRHIKIADSAEHARLGIAVDITSATAGDITLGKVKSSFQVFNGGGHSDELWYHYDLNKADVRTLQAPETMNGMQTLVSFIDGYKQLQEDRGIVYNRSADFVEYDSDTGMPVSWQLETERFIDWAYSLRRARLQFNDRFAFVVSSLTENTLRFTAAAPAWVAGSAIALTTTGSLPESLFAQTPYYFKPTTDPQVFKLCVTKRLSEADVVDLTTVGSGNMFSALYQKEQAYPAFEINPARNNVWIATPQGMLSDVLSGPYSDIRVAQTIYDQYGRFLTADKITVFREDTMNRVSVRSETPNDVELYPDGFYDPYNYLHIGGGHFFTEGYEHIIMFKNYSVGGDLIYDPFLGLYTTRFDIDYYEKTKYTMRPTLGGYYLAGNLFKRNFEGSLHDMRRYYDAFELTEGTTEAQYARHLLGYHPNDGSMSYLDLLNTNSKSQFLFYRGMIQMKGSVNSIKAFINSKKFVDAKIDEFWMYKISDFGDSRPKIYPKIRLHSTDSVDTDIRLKFTLPSDIDPNVLSDREKGFETVSFQNGDRWVDFPQQREEIVSPLFLDASITTMTSLYVTNIDETGNWMSSPTVPKSGEDTVDYWYNTPTNTYRSFVDGEWVVTNPAIDISFVHNNAYMNIGTKFDGVRVLSHRLTSPGCLDRYETRLMNEVDVPLGYTRVNSEIIKFPSASYNFYNITLDTANNNLLFHVVGDISRQLSTASQIFVRDMGNTSEQYSGGYVDGNPVITETGHNYTSKPTIIATGGNPVIPATFDVEGTTIDGIFNITNVITVNPGMGYTSAPQLVFDAPIPPSPVYQTASEYVTGIGGSIGTSGTTVNLVPVLYSASNFTHVNSMGITGNRLHGGYVATATNTMFIISAISTNEAACSLATSLDGKTWTPRTVKDPSGRIVATGNVVIVGNKFYALAQQQTGNYNTNHITDYTTFLTSSSDGVEWSIAATDIVPITHLQSDGATFILNTMYMVHTGTMFALLQPVAGTITQPTCFVSTDAVHWIQGGYPTGNVMVAVGSKLVAISTNYTNALSVNDIIIDHSVDGTTWTQSVLTAPGTHQYYRPEHITSVNGNLFVQFFGSSSSGDGYTYYNTSYTYYMAVSQDGGISWTVSTIGTGYSNTTITPDPSTPDTNVYSLSVFDDVVYNGSAYTVLSTRYDGTDAGIGESGKTYTTTKGIYQTVTPTAWSSSIAVNTTSVMATMEPQAILIASGQRLCITDCNQAALNYTVSGGIAGTATTTSTTRTTTTQTNDTSWAVAHAAASVVPVTFTERVTGNVVYTVSDIVFDGTDTLITAPRGAEVPGTTVSGTFDQYCFADRYTIFTIQPAADKINPARLLDTSSHVKIDDIPLWHPAYSLHSPLALHNISIKRATDPAGYSVTMLPNGSSTSPWSAPEVGTVWLDTSSLEYMPYYDDVIYPDINTRIYQWGKRPEWSDVKVYQWVETLVRPDDWDDTAAKQEGDITIPQKDKVTGTARKTIFKRTRNRVVVDVIVPELGFCIQTSSGDDLVDGDIIYFSPIDTDGTLPTTIIAGVEYYVAQYNTVTREFHVLDADGNQVDMTGAEQLCAVRPFGDDWVRKPLLRNRVYAALDYDFITNGNTIREPVLVLTDPLLVDGDVVDVYVNGTLLVQNLTVTSGTVDLVGTEYKMVVSDIIDVVRPYPSLTAEQLAYDAILDEDGTALEQWSESIEYTQTARTYGGITYTYYYFWVEGVTVLRNPEDNECISAKQAAIELADPSTPYLVVQDPVDDLWARGYDVPPWDKTGYDGELYSAYLSNNQFLPQIFYRKAILSKVSQYVSEDNRYAVEFTRDLTLRNTLETDHNQMNVKNKHEKWFMFRREQIGAVPHDLWIKMTEALMECKYDDFGAHLPSFEREHYDMVNGTETRYGLEKDQIFVNPSYARATLISYLQDPTHDFKPVDINHFFEVYPLTQDSFWKDPAKVKEMCDHIFNTFDSKHTNGIWFDILSDALVTKAKYKGLMKTSWLALHGIRILDVAGMFDDY